MEIKKSLGKSRLLSAAPKGDEWNDYSTSETTALGEYMGFKTSLVEIKRNPSVKGGVTTDNHIVDYSFFRNEKTGGMDVFSEHEPELNKESAYIHDSELLLRDGFDGMDYLVSEIEDVTIKDAFLLVLDDIQNKIMENY